MVNACEPSFRDLVRGALLTGCRYSELANMQAADFNRDAGIVTIRQSKAGKPHHNTMRTSRQAMLQIQFARISLILELLGKTMCALCNEANVVAELDSLSRVSSLIVAQLLHALLAILVPAAFHVRLAPQGTPNIGFRCACFRSVSDLVLRYQTSGIAARHKTYSLQLVFGVH